MYMFIWLCLIFFCVYVNWISSGTKDYIWYCHRKLDTVSIRPSVDRVQICIALYFILLLPGLSVKNKSLYSRCSSSPRASITFLPLWETCGLFILEISSCVEKCFSIHFTKTHFSFECRSHRAFVAAFLLLYHCWQREAVEWAQLFSY